ncbi:MAG: DUF368 domain-containing protein [Eubacteriales bacterium]
MKFVLDFLKGSVIGISNIIPGVSGGTMALVMGIYEKLTGAIGDIIINKAKRKEYGIFLGSILIGAVVGVLLFAELLTWLFSSPISSQHTYLFIIGLIIGSIPFILKIHHDMKVNLKRILLTTIGLLLVIILEQFGGKESASYNPLIKDTWFGILNITEFNLSYNLWLIICGFISSLAMVLPGISGSALLVSLGEYANILFIVDNRLIIPAIFFGIGVVIGIFICAKIVSVFLKKYTAETYYFIIGLMLASIYQIVFSSIDSFDLSGSVLSVSLVALMIGFCVTYFTSQIGEYKEIKK